MTIDITSDPAFQKLVQNYTALYQEVAELRAALPEFVDSVEAERLTGHSRTTLHRLRKDPKSLIRWKTDRGVRYLRASLIAHNNSHTANRRTSPTPSV